jgi:hypothetical protein
MNHSEFVLHIIPPPKRLNWTNPRRLLIRSFLNHLFADPAPIGHLFVEFGGDLANEQGVSRVLTGMSRISLQESSKVVRAEKLGLGSFFYDFRGRLDVATDALEEIEWAKRKKRYASIRVSLTAEKTAEMMKVMEEWIANGAFRHYGGGHRVETGTGSGCAEFGMFFLSMALGVKATHPDWFRSVIAPREFVGGKSFNGRKVSLLKMLFDGNQWAKSESDGYRYQTPDPELMFDWVVARGGEIELKPEDIHWSSAACDSMRFEGKYPRELPEIVSNEWQKIKLR